MVCEGLWSGPFDAILTGPSKDNLTGLILRMGCKGLRRAAQSCLSSRRDALVESQR